MRTKWNALWLSFGIHEEKEYFIENLAMLLSSGITIMSVLDAIQGEMVSRRMWRIIGNLKVNIERGLPLWQALQETRLFPLHIISLIKVGEESGRLNENLQVIVAQQERDRLFRSRVRSAALYPIFVLCFAVVAGSGIGWFILPRLAILYTSLRLQLPIFTQILIGIGKFLGVYGAIAVPLFLVVAGTIIYFSFFFSKTKFIGQAALLRLPGVGRLIREVELARMGYVLGTLLAAGLPIVASLNSLADAAGYHVYRKLYLYLRDHIEGGDSFKKCFSEYPGMRRLMPLPVRQLIISGEQSGHLAATLIKIGEIYEGKMELTSKNLATILEPLLLIIVWAVVLLIALAVVLPLYTLIGNIR